MKRCDLCDRTASMYCESDQAFLCWECDAKVHGANFLVARHTRELLCRNCQEQTPWRAAGSRLNPTISVCERCAAVRKAEQDGELEEEIGEAEAAEMMEEHEDDDEYDEDDSDVGEEEDEDEEGENQVVPWTLTPPPPPSSSGSEESSSPRRASASCFIRVRENAASGSQNEMNFFHSRRNQIPTGHLLSASLFCGSADSDTSAIQHPKDRQRSVPSHLPPPVTAGSSDHPAVNIASSSCCNPPI